MTQAWRHRGQQREYEGSDTPTLLTPSLRGRPRLTPRPTLLLACLGWMTLLRFAQAVARERFSLVPLAPHVPMRSDCQRRVCARPQMSYGSRLYKRFPERFEIFPPIPTPYTLKSAGLFGHGLQISLSLAWASETAPPSRFLYEWPRTSLC